MSETKTVVVERDLPFPPDRVWRGLTQPHLMREWLMKTVDGFSTERGTRFRLAGDWGGVDCEVLDADPPTRLSYRWDHAHEDPAFDLRSIVTFTLTPSDSGTHLRMEQSGFRPDQRQAWGGANYGWRENLANLEAALARAVD